MARWADTQTVVNYYDLVGGPAKEDLSEKIHKVEPEQTPVFSMLGSETIKQPKHEWQVQALNLGAIDNKHREDDPFEPDTFNFPARLVNYPQIFRKDIVTTRRADDTDTAGYQSEMARLKADASIEIKTDIEATLTYLQGGSAGAENGDGTLTTPSQFATLNDWISTNSQRGGGAGADSSLTGGLPGAAVDGTLRQLTGDMFMQTTEDIHIEGGTRQRLYAFCYPTLKRKISEYFFTPAARVTSLGQDVGKAPPEKGLTVSSNVTVIQTDFGPIELMPNVHMRTAARDLFILNPGYWKVGYFKRFYFRPQGDEGEMRRTILVTDLTLISKNESASAGIFDIDVSLGMA